jgi:hypothetical protein
MRSENTHPVAHPFRGEAFPLLAALHFPEPHIDGYGGRRERNWPICTILVQWSLTARAEFKGCIQPRNLFLVPPRNSSKQNPISRLQQNKQRKRGKKPVELRPKRFDINGWSGDVSDFARNNKMQPKRYKSKDNGYDSNTDN